MIQSFTSLKDRNGSRQVVSRRRAFQATHDGAIALCVSREERPLQPRADSDFPIQDPIWDLIKHCWAQNPDDRCTMETAYETLTAIYLRPD